MKVRGWRDRAGTDIIGMDMRTIAAIREQLRAACETLAIQALERKDSNPKAGRGIREGVSRARKVIDSVSTEGSDVAGYLRTLHEALEKEAEALRGSSDDDDGWDLGGLRSVILKVEELHRG